MGFLGKPVRDRGTKEWFCDELCPNCKKITAHKLKPCTGWFCVYCGNEHIYPLKKERLERGKGYYEEGG